MNRKRTAAGIGLSLGAAFAVPAAAHADLVVDNNSDDSGLNTCGAADNDCSLRGAIANANSGAEDTIRFAADVTGSITLGGTQLPTITGATYIYGPGADILAVDGNGMSRVFNIDVTTGGDDVEISGLTVRNGKVTGHGGGGTGNGAGVRNEDADLTLQSVVLTGNTNMGAGDSFGGGLYDYGKSPSDGADDVVIDSTISGNTAENYGGGIYASNKFGGIYRSTIAGNSSAQGAGVYAFLDMFIEDSTIAGNVATTSGGGLQSSALGTNPRLSGTIISGNTAPSGPDVYLSGPKTLDSSFSLIQNTSDFTFSPPGTGPNVLGVSPQLGPLQNNGGHVPTMKPAVTSPAIDKGASPAVSDARGLGRVFDFPGIASAPGGNGSDIGAVELQASDVPVTPAALTGRRAAALKKCKKKKRAKARKKCKKRAKKLPL